METIAIISFLGGLAIGSIAALWCAAKVFSKENEDSKNAEFEENLDREVLSKSVQYDTQIGYLDKCIRFEKEKGREYLYNAISKLLRLTTDNNLIVNRIMENTPVNSVVFLTGIGKVYPFVRAHNVLNNLHQVFDKVPVIMFYPGNWNGQSLSLFGTISDGNYYRAFPLIQ